MAKLNIGAKQARRLCQKSANERITFIAEGLPIILKSARGFWAASESLAGHPREAEVLEGFAEEEAAKILILFDIVRCPQKVISERLSALTKYFYDHLARCLYAEAQRWKAVDIATLQGYLDIERRAHYLEGYAGEYILPNQTISRRESLLYADIQSYEADELVWNDPHVIHSGLTRLKPVALTLSEALEAVGAFTLPGLKAAAEIWDGLEFKEKETWEDEQKLAEDFIGRLINEDLPNNTASQNDVNWLYNTWQMPMYNMDFKEIDVPLDELKAQQEAMFYSEFGDPGY